ncbi:MAG TPA: ATP-binding protein [Candidatus Eisenbacteria bacterium]|nr:ATP-binding protein [Candidatus Eisenbacteria bacterium]
MRVLFVEDNDDDALLIQEALADTVIKIDRAERLSSALEKLSAGDIDAVLLDLSLPDAHGLDTIARVRSHSPGVPIVVLTGLDDEEAAVKAVEQGAQDYLNKGHVHGQLLARSLRYAIQRHRSEERLKERNRELSVLTRISEIIMGSLDMQWILDQVLGEAMVVGSFDLGNFRLLDPNSDSLVIVAAQGYRDAENIRRHRTLSRNIEAEQSSRFRDLLFEQPCVEEHVQTCAGLRTLKREGIESFVQVPIRAEGEVLGTLQLASRTPRNFGRAEINLFLTIGNYVGIAVQRARLYEQTKRQAAELERANKLQADFSAMIAHDLRSPLMNIMGVAEVMIDGMFGSVNEEQKKWLSRIQASGRSLVDLVSDFLDLSKLESGYVALKKERVALGDLVHKSVENYRVLALDKRISIRDAVDSALPSIDADPRRLDQVLSNLISNAVKFTGDGGEIEVGAKPTDAGHILIWVKDNGVGIEAEEMGLLFEKYRQAQNVKRSNEKGTGLGLVICKMIVEAHGGKIWAESKPGTGSTFFLSLPIAPD